MAGKVPVWNTAYHQVPYFAPDGIERFHDAWRHRVEVEGLPVFGIDDIITRTEATGRSKDLEPLPRLKSFREYLKGK